MKEEWRKLVQLPGIDHRAKTVEIIKKYRYRDNLLRCIEQVAEHHGIELTDEQVFRIIGPLARISFGRLAAQRAANYLETRGSYNIRQGELKAEDFMWALEQITPDDHNV